MFDEFGDLLKRFRKGSNKTIDQVAKELGTTRSYYLQLQSGSAPSPQPRKTSEIAKVLNLSDNETEELIRASLKDKHMLNLKDLGDELATKVKELVIDYFKG